MTGKENLVYLKKDMIDIELQLLIENSLQFGHQLFLEDIEEEIQDSYDDVNSGFMQVLLNKKVKEGNVYKLKMREKIVDIHPDFRFYITTKLANPHFKPEICIKA